MSDAPGGGERRLLAILAADVVGYSAMMEADESGTLARLAALRGDRFDPAVARHRGRIVKLMGDGMLVAFDSVVDAVACAAAIQQAQAAHNAAAAPADRVELRIGVNLGDVVLVGDDIYGSGVNIAARLETLCEPGGVAVSGTAYDQLHGTLGLPLEFAGEHQVKNIARAVRVYRLRLGGAPAPVKAPAGKGRRRGRLLLPLAAGLLLLALAGGGAWWLLAPAAPPAKPSLAVLPFASIAADEATGRLADGLTEDIVSDLVSFPQFDVIARNSTEGYKGRAVDPQQVAGRLGVRYLLRGTIQRDGGRVRITAELLEGGSGRALWSQRWDRPAEDLFAVQTEIGEAVVNRLGGSAGLIQQAERSAAKRRRPGNLGAYELYLLAGEKLDQPSRAGVEAAIGLLDRAIALDPGLARAWVALSHARRESESFAADPAAAARAALDAANRAVALDPGDAEAHAALGAVLGDANQFAQAKAELDAALRLAPNDADILTRYSDWGATFGDPARGAAMADRAIRLDPGYTPAAAAIFAYAYFAAGRHADALALLERLPPEDYSEQSLVIRAAALAALGRADEARTWVAEALRRHPDLTVESMANEDGYSPAEHRHLIETMTKAGFPLCADAKALAAYAKPVRLPGCGGG
jgi:class 3 adenylate cyclase/TolB-like protein/cytochrome c-type biogenesis protein CcmH/NrfG